MSTGDECIVCGKPMQEGLLPWHVLCPTCRYECAKLTPVINNREAHLNIDEEERETALKTLREENFKVIVRHLLPLIQTKHKRLLDVGCAHGWFLDEASQKFNAQGIEPDLSIGQKAIQHGKSVRIGMFPDALHPEEKFDVIVFNDVLEHIPSIKTAFDSIHSHMDEKGLLVVNLPNSRGFFYRLAKIFLRLGWASPFERMWQLGLPSPHIHYFDKTNLPLLAESHHFELVSYFTLPSLRMAGLRERIGFADGTRGARHFIQYLALLSIIPFLAFLPSDIIVCVFRKREAATQGSKRT